ncbi:acyl-[ACP]--phospholipid O-acyltransferase [Rhizobium laguerreae]|uniref:acyl-[ACP]--phospholipid O-acyltransferase n=1 Tax=Rhizobium laguerreae TaxID=1076926 RepID=UPI001C8FD46D|nr:acyl-[ACP]--phospholipid O-acyltransferase [Rhizobium laguerreae]MBY3150902.1 acyl-[ACP]--phospholipid O-acyltransferase [Rhizobium laguerreae]
MPDSTIYSNRFMPLFFTQALAAFTDNFMKNFLIFFVLATVGHQAGAVYITAAGAVFMLPFVLLSGLGGEMADKYDKAWVARKLKFLEIGAAVVAAAGFSMQSIPVMMTAVFLFGVGSALFGPLKYGILPDHLPLGKLPKANAWIEAATFVAILAGTVFAGLTFKVAQTAAAPFATLIVVLAIACYACSRMIPPTEAADPSVTIDVNVFRSSIRYLRELGRDSRLLRASLMVSFFWFVGAITLSILPPAVQSLGGDETAVTAYMAIFAASIALGSAAAAWLSGGRIVLLPAVFGTFVAGLFALDFGYALSVTPQAANSLPLLDFFALPTPMRLALDVSMMAFFGAFVSVPTFAAIQAWADNERRARVVAANNILNAVFMVAGAALMGGLQAAGATSGFVSVVLGALCIAAALATFFFLPTKALRDFLFVLFRVLYRLEVKGIENLDNAGRNPVLALTHVSFLDAALAMALTDLDPVFAINADIARKWWVRPFLKIVNALPLDPSKPMATRSLIRVVESGRPVAIFPEGRITVTGTLMKIYDGAAMVADKTGVPIVPIRIDGLERTHFSRLRADQIAKSLFPKVKVTILPPAPLSVDPQLKGRRRRQEAGSALYDVMSDLVFQTSRKTGTIIEEVIRAADTYGHKKVILQDPLSGDMTYGKLLTAARVLGGKFSKLFAKDNLVGVMLPNSTGSAAVFLGVISSGKVPSMINFTAGSNGVLAACRASRTKVVLTSRAFVEKAKLENLVADMSEIVEIVYTEDVRASVTLVDKLVGAVMKRRPLVRRKPDDMAVVLYTSGSESLPKGVALSHANVLSNATQASARIDFSPKDKLFNVLPLFHAFGLTGGLILPVVSGVCVYLYPSPLHYRIVPELIYASNATIIFGTDTFLNGYAKTANAYDFRSIRYIFAGAEKVYDSTRQTYMSKFGIRILEGYGVTEAAPIVCINSPMFNKSGSVGRFMPGIEHRLEPFDGWPTGGQLFIRGPNIMMGYLKESEPGVLHPPKDGWHDTGDVVVVDAEGFVTIVDRAGRFANIAGEKVSLAEVQSLVNSIWPGTLSVAVNLPDPRKGERIVVLTERTDATLQELKAAAKAKGLQELVVPSAVTIGKVPVLGTGKVDFQSSKKAAAAA